MAIDLGAIEVGGPLSADEARWVNEARTLAPLAAADQRRLRDALFAGADPLGITLAALRPAVTRRGLGAFYTPPELVGPMVSWALARHPGRVIDVGCGSGRFAGAVVRRQPDLALIAVDIDPISTLLTRAALAALGARAARVIHADYTTVQLDAIAGRTAYVGNPPYVRHHDLSPEVKAWARSVARRFGYPTSGLAGLHAYFYLATALHARPGDIGCFVTSAEWLDVNYGAIMRHLLTHDLGVQALHVFDPTAVPFPDAMTTAAVACFEVGSQTSDLRLALVRRLSDLAALGEGRPVQLNLLREAARWSPFLRATVPTSDTDRAPLRQIARVHRGVATGANEFFVLTPDRAQALGLMPWCRPAITKAQEILTAGGVVKATPDRRLLLDLPADFDRAAHPAVDCYLKSGEVSQDGRPPISERYLCRHRRPWWRLGVGSPPPIVVTYMARQAPAFALNPDGLVPLNIAHGIYPHRPLAPEQLATLAERLNGLRGSFQGAGRTYHGGMEKFEPREFEALAIPCQGLGL